MINKLILRHTDTGILNRDSAIVFIHLHVDLQLGIWVEHILIRQHLEAQAVDRIRRVREQFA